MARNAAIQTATRSTRAVTKKIADRQRVHHDDVQDVAHVRDPAQLLAQLGARLARRGDRTVGAGSTSRSAAGIRVVGHHRDVTLITTYGSIA